MMGLRNRRRILKTWRFSGEFKKFRVGSLSNSLDLGGVGSANKPNYS
jgi:hypothetical protein